MERNKKGEMKGGKNRVRTEEVIGERRRKGKGNKQGNGGSGRGKEDRESEKEIKDEIE